MIRIHSLCKSYRSGTEAPAVILQNVEFQVARGEFAAITGPSGSGKTTLLNIIGALDNDYDGSVAINGQDMRSLNDRRLSEFRNQTVGFVFQHSNLLAPLTARENVLLPGYFARKGENEAALNARADQLLERVGLGAKGHHLPSQLSGGERQRVAIARALLCNPPLILCDEPTGNLDSATGTAIIRLFQELQAEANLTLIVVTHDARVSGAAKRILQLENHRVVEG